jgi:hypothetical protein
MMRALYLALTNEVDHHFGRIIAHPQGNRPV